MNQGHLTDIAGAAARSIAILAAFHKSSINTEDALEALTLGSQTPTPRDLVRAIKRLGFSSEQRSLEVDQLTNTLLPALAVSAEGHPFIIARASETKALIQMGPNFRPRTVSIEQLSVMWHGTIILFGASKASRQESPEENFLKNWIWAVARKYRHILLEVLTASFFVQTIALATPIIFQVVIDRVFSYGAQSTLQVMILALIVVGIFEAIINIIRGYLLNHTAARIDVELSSKFFEHLISLPAKFFDSKRAGIIVAKVKELDSVRNFVTSSTITVIVDLVFTVVFFLIMLAYSSTLTSIVSVSVILYFVLSFIITGPLRSRVGEQFSTGAANQAFLTETIANAKAVKSLSLERPLQREWEDKTANHATANFRAVQLGMLGTEGTKLISRTTSAAVLFFGAGIVIDGDLSFGQFIAFNMFANRVSEPIIRLAQLWQDFQQARVGFRKASELVATPSERGIRRSSSRMPQVLGQLVIDRISFGYREDHALIIEDFSARIEAGECVALIGPSGAGKTTFLKLLLRMYDPTKGSIRLDGVDLASAPPRWLRESIGVAPQEPDLFSRTVYDNIAFGARNVTPEAVQQACLDACATEFVNKLPEGLDTVVDERGANFSGGQRQRLGIARALVRNPKLLILDEPTSALDVATKAEFVRNFAEIRKGRTVIVATHDESVIQMCDRTIAL